MDSVVNNGSVIISNNIAEVIMVKFKRKMEPSVVTHS